MQLGELAADGNLTLGKDLRHGLERRHDAMWRLVEDECTGHHGKALQPTHTVTMFATQKPSKKKCSQGMPDDTSAVTHAEGPGMTSTGTSTSRAASTSAWPGSDTLGIPASEAKARVSPPADGRPDRRHGLQ